MAGYDWINGMSNNAVEAYDDGMAPSSKIPGIPSPLVKKYGSPSEWHHTASWFNKTDFYKIECVRTIFGLEDCGCCEPNPEAIESLKNHKKGKKEITIYENCQVRWIEWSGSRNHPRATDCEESGCRVEVSGETAKIFRKGSETHFLTKRLSTRGFYFNPVGGIR